MRSRLDGLNIKKRIGAEYGNAANCPLPAALSRLFLAHRCYDRLFSGTYDLAAAPI